MCCFISRSWLGRFASYGVLGFVLSSMPGVTQAFAQAPAAPTFEELSSKAQSVIDSDPTQAAALLKQALAVKPSWAEGWLYMGGTLYRLGRYQEAVDAFHKGTSLEPQIGTGWAFLGMAEAELKKDQQALTDIGKGETLGLGANPQFEAAARQTAAMILIRHSMFDQALGQLQPLSKYPDMPAPVIEAAGLITLTIPTPMSELPESRRAIVRLAGEAQWASVTKRPAEAEAAYKKLMAEYANEPGVHYAYGLHLMGVDDMAALEQFQTELKTNTNHWPSMLVSAFLMSRNGDAETALKMAQRASKVAPAQYRWLCDAEEGRAYLTMDQPDKAIAAFEESVKLQPGNAETHHFLEQAYRRAGRKADAQRESQIFLKLKEAEDPKAVPNAQGGPQGGAK
jgi:predicted Zn-dependent protease